MTLLHILPPSQINYRYIRKNYQQDLAVLFAVNEINKNSELLPNISLGLHILENYFNIKFTYLSTLDLLSTQFATIPNYKCDKKDDLLATIGGLSSESSIAMATVLSLYKIPQVGCVLDVAVSQNCSSRT